MSVNFFFRFRSFFFGSEDSAVAAVEEVDVVAAGDVEFVVCASEKWKIDVKIKG